MDLLNNNVLNLLISDNNRLRVILAYCALFGGNVYDVIKSAASQPELLTQLAADNPDDQNVCDAIYWYFRDAINVEMSHS